jgi:nucleotide-binding universal stress UspA family protein
MKLIIVGVDGSETAHAAAEIAASLAQATGARLHVVSAYQEKASKAIDGGPEFGMLTSLDQAEALLDGIASELRSKVATVTTAAIEGKAAEGVCSVAEETDADLIVVGNKRVQGLSRVLGSVATKILQSSPCDVYVAHTT